MRLVRHGHPGDRGIVPVVTMEGEVDLVTAPLLLERLSDAARAGSPWVVLDLTGVTFLDSTALGVVVIADQRCRDHGAGLRVVITPPGVQRVFDAADLREILDVRSSLEDALGAPVRRLEPLPA